MRQEMIEIETFLEVLTEWMFIIKSNSSSPQHSHSQWTVNTFQLLSLLFYHQNQNMQFSRTFPHSHVLTRFSRVAWPSVVFIELLYTLFLMGLYKKMWPCAKLSTLIEILNNIKFDLKTTTTTKIISASSTLLYYMDRSCKY